MLNKKAGFVYIIASDKMGTLYIGSSSDLIARVAQHKEKFYGGFTTKYGVDKIVYYEFFEDMELMVRRERQLKEWKRNWKLRLIISKNPYWIDLWDEIRGAGIHAYAEPVPEYKPDEINIQTA
ncbi:MAG: GIY-YIG nuclease family protein [Alphaproteobacteria bacterium]|nr:GIY-YIG nuclease family protein [Alphaproteobacteria bacterium]MCL2757877.1 GIY-YIG nuclease family protein [Alphaproteobacteria bacterium]